MRSATPRRTASPRPWARPPASLSTIYRNLEALEGVGVVSHTHLDHRAPTYHLADHADHVHLVCLSCGAVIESAVAAADPFVGNLLTRYGFVADGDTWRYTDGA